MCGINKKNSFYTTYSIDPQFELILRCCERNRAKKSAKFSRIYNTHNLSCLLNNKEHFGIYSYFVQHFSYFRAFMPLKSASFHVQNNRFTIFVCFISTKWHRPDENCVLMDPIRRRYTYQFSYSKYEMGIEMVLQSKCTYGSTFWRQIYPLEMKRFFRLLHIRIFQNENKDFWTFKEYCIFSAIQRNIVGKCRFNMKIDE